MGLPEGTNTMCLNHPDAPATSFCSSCGMPLCALCARQSFGTVLCPSCLAARQGAAPSPEANAPAEAPVDAGHRVLRPLGYVDLIDEAFSLYKRHFVLLVGVFAIVNFPASFIMNLAVGKMDQGNEARRTSTVMFAAPFEGPAGMQRPAPPDLTTVLSILLTLLVSFFAAVCAQGALTRGVADTYLGKPTSIGQCYSFILSNFLSFLWTFFLATLVSMVGIMLCCVGVFWGSFAASCFVVEGARGMGAIQRSMELARGNWRRCLNVFVFATIMVQIGTAVVVAPVQVVVGLFGSNFAPGPLIIAMVNSAVLSVLQPLQLIASVLLYFDIRVRREGFDIQLLAESLNRP